MANSLANIPTLDAVHPGAIENAASGISKAGSGIRGAGVDVASAWGKLHGVYKAPEAGELIGAVNPIRDQTDRFGWEVGQVGAALSDYAAEIAPVKAKLTALKAAAGLMLMDQAATDGGESHWRRKQSNVDAENKLLHEVAVAVNEAHQIAAKCANRINGLTGGTQFHGGAVPTGSPDAYWSNDPSHLSWAAPVQKDNPWWKDGLNGAVGFGKGVVVDGAWGMVKGVGAMAGFGPKGWDWHNAWNSYKAIETLGLPLMVPGAIALPSVRKAEIGFGKDFVAWDEWKKDKGRAAGKVGFNVLTLGIPETRLGMAGKAGDAALAITKGANKVDVVGRGFSLGLRAGTKGVTAGLDAVKNLHVGEGLTHMKGIHLNGLDKLPDASAPKTGLGHFDLKDPNVTVPNKVSAPPVHAMPHARPTVAQVADHMKSKYPHDAGTTGAPKHPSTPVDGKHVTPATHSTPAVDPAAGSHVPPVIGGHPPAPAHVPYDPAAGALPHGGSHVSPVIGGHPPAPVHGPPSVPHDPAAGALPHGGPHVSPVTSLHPHAGAHDPLSALHGPGGGAHAPTVEDQMKLAQAKVAEGTRPFHDDHDAAQYGADHWNDYTKHLPQAQKDAFERYTSHHYRGINGHLRFGDPADPADLHAIEEIDKAMRGNPLPDDVVISRGTDLDHISTPVELMGGGVYHEAGYMSTSLGSPAGAFEGKDAILHLRVPKGTPAIWVEKVGSYGAGERELLLGRDFDYRVDKTIMDSHGQWHVYGEVLPK